MNTKQPEELIKIAQSFRPYEKPENSLSVRCHVLDGSKVKILEDLMAQELPWCYITKNHLEQRSEETGLSLSEILANKFPDPGSVMSGDFGEITTMFFLSDEKIEKTKEIKKWCFKQDRNKPAPHSDVIILYRENNTKPSKKDFVICAESKQKATPSSFDPIGSSIVGYESDKTGRLARTLVWLKEKSIDQGSSETIDFINRFTDDLLKIEFVKNFKAVAIIDCDLLNEEITREIELPEQNDEFEVIVLGIDNLKELYETSFERAKAEVKIEQPTS